MGESMWMLRVSLAGAVAMALIGVVALADMSNFLESGDGLTFEQPNLDRNNTPIYFSLIDSLSADINPSDLGVISEQGRLFKHLSWLSWNLDNNGNGRQARPMQPEGVGEVEYRTASLVEPASCCR